MSENGIQRNFGIATIFLNKTLSRWLARGSFRGQCIWVQINFCKIFAQICVEHWWLDEIGISRSLVYILAWFIFVKINPGKVCTLCRISQPAQQIIGVSLTKGVKPLQLLAVLSIVKDWLKLCSQLRLTIRPITLLVKSRRFFRGTT